MREFPIYGAINVVSDALFGQTLSQGDGHSVSEAW